MLSVNKDFIPMHESRNPYAKAEATNIVPALDEFVAFGHSPELTVLRGSDAPLSTAQLDATAKVYAQTQGNEDQATLTAEFVTYAHDLDEMIDGSGPLSREQLAEAARHFASHEPTPGTANRKNSKTTSETKNASFEAFVQENLKFSGDNVKQSKNDTFSLVTFGNTAEMAKSNDEQPRRSLSELSEAFVAANKTKHVELYENKEFFPEGHKKAGLGTGVDMIPRRVTVGRHETAIDEILTEIAENFAVSAHKGISEDRILTALVSMDKKLKLSVKDFSKFTNKYYAALDILGGIPNATDTDDDLENEKTAKPTVQMPKSAKSAEKPAEPTTNVTDIFRNVHALQEAPAELAVEETPADVPVEETAPVAEPATVQEPEASEPAVESIDEPVDAAETAEVVAKNIGDFKPIEQIVEPEQRTRSYEGSIPLHLRERAVYARAKANAEKKNSTSVPVETAPEAAPISRIMPVQDLFASLASTAEVPATEPANNEKVKQYSFEVGLAEHAEYGEDTALIDEDMKLYGVFDGMGSGLNPKFASQLAADTVKELFANAPEATSIEEVHALMQEAFKLIREYITNDPNNSNEVTTATIIKLIETEKDGLVLVLGQAGDSRAFVFNAATGTYTSIAEDQSEGNRIHNGLGKSQGTWPRVKDQFAFYAKNKDGDASILICSDGITGDWDYQFLSEAEMLQAFSMPTAAEAAQEFINVSKKHDDKTAIVINIKQIEGTEAGSTAEGAPAADAVQPVEGPAEVGEPVEAVKAPTVVDPPVAEAAQAESDPVEEEPQPILNESAGHTPEPLEPGELSLEVLSKKNVDEIIKAIKAVIWTNLEKGIAYDLVMGSTKEPTELLSLTKDAIAIAARNAASDEGDALARTLPESNHKLNAMLMNVQNEFIDFAKKEEVNDRRAKWEAARGPESRSMIASLAKVELVELKKIRDTKGSLMGHFLDADGKLTEKGKELVTKLNQAAEIEVRQVDAPADESNKAREDYEKAVKARNDLVNELVAQTQADIFTFMKNRNVATDEDRKAWGVDKKHGHDDQESHPLSPEEEKVKLDAARLEVEQMVEDIMFTIPGSTEKAALDNIYKAQKQKAGNKVDFDSTLTGQVLLKMKTEALNKAPVEVLPVIDVPSLEKTDAETIRELRKKAYIEIQEDIEARKVMNPTASKLEVIDEVFAELKKAHIEENRYIQFSNTTIYRALMQAITEAIIVDKGYLGKLTSLQSLEINNEVKERMAALEKSTEEGPAQSIRSRILNRLISK